MGISYTSCLFYGLPFDGPEEFEDEFDNEFSIFYLVKEKGWKDSYDDGKGNFYDYKTSTEEERTAFFEMRDAAIAEIPRVETTYVGSFYDEAKLYLSFSHVQNYTLEPTEVEMSVFDLPSNEEVIKVREFLVKNGIEWHNPRWYLGLLIG